MKAERSAEPKGHTELVDPVLFSCLGGRLLLSPGGPWSQDLYDDTVTGQDAERV